MPIRWQVGGHRRPNEAGIDARRPRDQSRRRGRLYDGRSGLQFSCFNFFSEVATRRKFLRHITETDVRHTSAAVLVGLLEESKQRRAG
jgi:hypothetical protein